MSGLDVPALRSACDQLLATAPDPTAASAVIVRVWALGAAAADDLLADLRDAAAGHARRTGTEPTAAELLSAVGRHRDAALVRDAVERGLGEHRAGLDAAARAEAATRAARVAVRLAQVHHHRTRATPAA